MRVSPAQAAKLRDLRDGHSLRRSELAKSLCDDLLQRQALRLQRNGAGYRIQADPARLEAVLANHYSIRDLNGYIAQQNPAERSRAELTRFTGNSKTLPTPPLRGLFFGVIGEADIFIEGTSTRPPPGTALFVPASRLEKLTLKPCRILGVENAEAFLGAQNLELPLPSPAVTVMRWNWGEEWRKWVQRHQPEVFYAGDYDWAGVAIYENEVLPIAPEATFLIPENLLKKLHSGNPDLFADQEEKYRNYQPKSKAGATLYATIKSARKALEQEALIAD
jgi:hypothetical protein